MIFYVENPKEYIIKLPGLISQLSKITRYKTLTYKSQLYFCILEMNNGNLKFQCCCSNIKHMTYLRTPFTKYLQYLYMKTEKNVAEGNLKGAPKQRERYMVLVGQRTPYC